jgi:hypothetical protein
MWPIFPVTRSPLPRKLFGGKLPNLVESALAAFEIGGILEGDMWRVMGIQTASSASCIAARVRMPFGDLSVSIIV